MVVIFSADDARFTGLSEAVVMRNTLSTPPTAEGVTYVLHSDTFNSDDVVFWGPRIPYRLIIITDKIPRLSKEAEQYAIIEDSLKRLKTNYNREISAVFNWSERLRVLPQAEQIPIPLMLAFLKVNRPNDIDLWRRIAQVSMTLNDSYMHALFTYGLTPSRTSPVWPKKKKTAESPPPPFRSNDKHWRVIIENPVVANEVRDESDGELPKGMKKTKERVNTWV